MYEHYASKDSAMAVYNSTKKKKLTTTHLLVRYFDVGINEDGYWNHDQMDLQNEYITYSSFFL